MLCTWSTTSRRAKRRRRTLRVRLTQMIGDFLVLPRDVNPLCIGALSLLCNPSIHPSTHPSSFRLLAFIVFPGVAAVHEEMRKQRDEYEEVIKQMEHEHDVEIAWLEKDAEDKLSKTREATASARAKMANMVQKFEGNQNVLNTLKILNNEQDDVLRKREEQIMSLKRDVKRNKQQCKLKEVEVTKKQHDLANARQAAAGTRRLIHSC